ncbi:MAG: hypothetical protein KatS3mg124_1048 [Porticoccaceae bacterium]|nr:MAG: hypothetical protein KatS3mg124_1048 [Porticoccaceae bacterium]
MSGKGRVILVATHRPGERALLARLLRGAVPGAELRLAEDPVALGRYLAAGAVDALLAAADLPWRAIAQLVAEVRTANPEAIVALYDDRGPGTIAPEVAGWGLAAWLTRAPEDLLRLVDLIAARCRASPPAARLPLAAGLAHDLRAPLHLLRRQLEELAREPLAPEIAGKVAAARSSGQRLAERFEAILAEAARSGVSSAAAALAEPVDLGALVQEVVDLFAPLIRERGATVEVAELPRVRAPPETLARIFQNLLDNALKAAGDAPLRVSIEAVDAGDHWLFTVEDNGRGMDPARLEEALAGRAGLGLALCRDLVAQLGGTLRGRSAPGAGTAILFTLPKEPGAVGV